MLWEWGICLFLGNRAGKKSMCSVLVSPDGGQVMNFDTTRRCNPWRRTGERIHMKSRFGSFGSYLRSARPALCSIHSWAPALRSLLQGILGERQSESKLWSNTVKLLQKDSPSSSFLRGNNEHHLGALRSREAISAKPSGDDLFACKARDAGARAEA